MSELKKQNGKYYKPCNVFIRPSTKNPIDDKIGLHIAYNSLQRMQRKLLGNKFFDTIDGSPAHGLVIPQYLYVTNDEPIITGNWYFDTLTKEIYQAKNNNVTMKCFEKIIATDDESLTNGWLKDLDPFRLSEHTNLVSMSGLPILPDSFINKYIEYWNNSPTGSIITKVFVEYDFADHDLALFKDERTLKINPDKTILIKSIKTNWETSEVEDLCRKAYLAGQGNIIGQDKFVEENIF